MPSRHAAALSPSTTNSGRAGSPAATRSAPKSGSSAVRSPRSPGMPVAAPEDALLAAAKIHAHVLRHRPARRVPDHVDRLPARPADRGPRDTQPPREIERAALGAAGIAPPDAFVATPPGGRPVVVVGRAEKADLPPRAAARARQASAVQGREQLLRRPHQAPPIASDSLSPVTEAGARSPRSSWLTIVRRSTSAPDRRPRLGDPPGHRTPAPRACGRPGRRLARAALRGCARSAAGAGWPAWWSGESGR